MEAVILAGGLGMRLRSVVHDVPKCMALVAGKPFLAYLLEGLAREGVDHVVLSVGYLREAVMDWVDTREWPFKVSYAVEEAPLGTGGGIRRALSYCCEDKVLVLNGDTLFHADVAALDTGAAVSIALKPMRDFDRYGSVILEGDRVVCFEEKLPCAEGLVNGGVYLIDRTRLDLSAFPEKFSFEQDALVPGALAGQVGGVVQDGYFIDIGIPEDYVRAQQELPELQAVLTASDAVLAAEADTLFLDRDGVINRLVAGDYVRDWSQFHFLPGILESLRAWAGKFRHILIVTNQRGVGRGLMDETALSDIHARMCAEISRAGGRIDGIYVCTAMDPADPCRKPGTGLFFQACADFPDIDPARCVMLGDAPSDIEFARRCNMAAVRVSFPG